MQAEQIDSSIPPIELDCGFAHLAVYQQDPRSATGQQAATRAIAAFERYLSLRPDEERARVYLIQTFVDTGRYEDAVAFFRPQVEKQPPDPQALATLGIIANKTGRYDDARKWYEQRITVEPNNLEARLALGILMWDRLQSHAEIAGADRIKLADEAIAQLGKAIEINPKAPTAHVYTNLVYRERAAGEPDDDAKQKDLEQARKFYQQGLALSKAK